MGAAGHWLTCMWYFCGAVQTADVDRCVNSPPSKPLQSNLSLCRGGASSFSVSNDCLSPHIWLSRIWNRYGVPLEGWVYRYFGGVDNLDETGKGPVPRYLTALYFAYATMTTVGYGDLAATTSVEMYGAIVAMVVGTIVFSLTVGMLQAILRAGNPEGRLKYKQINRLVGLMRCAHRYYQNCR